MTEMVVIECEVTTLTDKAVLIHYYDIREDIQKQWIPLSLCDASDTIEVDDKEITIAKWFADREGLPY